MRFLEVLASSVAFSAGAAAAGCGACDVGLRLKHVDVTVISAIKEEVLKDSGCRTNW